MTSGDEVPPTITKKPIIRQEDDGNTIIFECQLISNPCPVIIWYRNDERIHDDHRASGKISDIGPNKYMVTLEIKDISDHDAGLYKIWAKNKEGEVSASISLKFTRKYNIDSII